MTVSRHYDKQLAAGLALVPNLDLRDVLHARTTVSSMASRVTETDMADVDVSEVALRLEPGTSRQLRIVTPRSSGTSLPVIYDLHAGGYCTGSIDNVLARDIELSREVGAIVVAIDYRLAPEYPYPVPLEDCYAGLQWITANAEALGADRHRIAVHGQSAGGGLAAALALLARDRGDSAVHFLYLYAPELDDRMLTDSVRSYVDTPLWNQASTILSWQYYLGEGKPGATDVPSYAAPGRAEDLTGLPPTYVAVTQFDPLRDEGISFAQQLLQAGAPVELHVFPGTFHGSRNLRTADVSQRELVEEVLVLRRALHSRDR